ncbi:MAG: glycosyltransferase family 2 protein [Chloroflexota bacterium]|nr:glycosyltransferase family 2 protein [Chloroflexota bacterium]
MKLSVIIPAYNEQLTIIEVLQRVQEVELEKEIIVVNDGSTDGTGDLLNQRAAKNVHIVHLPVNGGKGAAIREGLRHATGEVVVIQDADLEQDPQAYRAMLEFITSGKARVVYGSRFAKPALNVRWANWFANRLLTWLTNLLYGSQLTDMETAYKMFRREVILDIPLNCQRFEFEPEVTAKLLKRGEPILELPIDYSPRTRDQGKKIGWRDGVEAIVTIIRYRFAD